MKISFAFFIFAFTLFVSSLYCPHLFAQHESQNAVNKNLIKIDIVPYYYVLFDTRKQKRFALEYEYSLNKKSSVVLYADAGIFDDYTFTKYYDFFNTMPSYVEQTVKIKGFHAQPAYNHNFLFSRKKPNHCVFTGATIDIHYYRKHFEVFDSRTSEKLVYNYNQTVVGAGIHAGVKYNLGSHFFAEIKTCLFLRIFRHVSLDGMMPVKPMNAQWSNSDYKMWWQTSIKIAYAF